MSDFYVGQKVVCIMEGEWRLRYPEIQVPEKGRVYTVRGITYFDIEGLYLVEIVNPPMQWGSGFGENNWDSSEFRPYEERKTDISIFEKILKGEHRVVLEDELY